MQPHILAIDDGPFTLHQDTVTNLVAVMMQGSSVIEGVAVSSFDIDGDGITAFLADWVRSHAWFSSIQAVVLGGITIAGLAVVDVMMLANLLHKPVLSVTRKDPAQSQLTHALEAAHLHSRIEILHRTPAAMLFEKGIFFRFAGTTQECAEEILRSSLGKARLPEALRVAHLIAAAIAQGQSHGRA